MVEGRVGCFGFFVPFFHVDGVDGGLHPVVLRVFFGVIVTCEDGVWEVSDLVCEVGEVEGVVVFLEEESVVF